MTKGKGLTTIALTASLLLLGAACRQETAPPAGGDGAPAPEVTTIEEGVLTVGTDFPYPPFEYGPSNEPRGFDVEIMNEIASRIGVPETVWVDAVFDTIFTDLAAGQFDVVISGATITPEREQQVNFSDPYFLSLQALVVQEGSGISSFDDLGEGDSVSVQTGTTGEIWAEENLQPNGVELRAFPDYPPIYNALEAGQVDGVVYDESSAIPETFNRPGLEVIDTVNTNEFYGIAVDPNNEDLLDAINGALADMIEDGTYDQIYDSFPDCTEEEVKTCMVPGGRISEAEQA
jgi:polar amino acid transport system substrate-binding protein